jgi:hypothetical protein
LSGFLVYRAFFLLVLLFSIFSNFDFLIFHPVNLKKNRSEPILSVFMKTKQFCSHPIFLEEIQP